MSYIKEFKIYGLCGSREPVKYRLNRDLNIIFGLNGSGKTSLLKILHSAMKHQPISKKEAFFENAEVKITSDERNFVKKIDLTEKSVKTIKQSQWHCTDTDEKCFKHVYLSTTRLFMDIEKFTRPYMLDDKGEAEDIFNKIFEKGLVNSWASYYSIISKKIRDAQQEGLTNIFNEVFREKSKLTKSSQEYDSNTAFEKVRNFLKRQNSVLTIGDFESFANRLKEDDLLERVVIQIENVESKIENYSAPIYQLNEVVSKLFTGNKKVIFEDEKIRVVTDEEKFINLSQLSSGEKNLLKILIELFLVEDSSLLIDEPELSLHIDWQRDLVKTMRTLNPDAQIILATHSPDILGSAAESETFFLK